MKSEFLSALVLEDLPGKWWRLTEDLVYHSERLDAAIVAPKGMVTDLASVPRLPVAYWLFGATGNAPAVIHDWLYRTALVQRLEADKVFCEALKSTGKWGVTRWTMTAAVMTFGGLVYKPRPGCLDIRFCNAEPSCVYCAEYYKNWKKTLRPHRK